MADADRIKWEQRYRAGARAETGPDPLVVQAAEHAPVGRALDLACGRGRHAIYLARQGFAVDAVDISATGLGWARKRAGDLRILWIEADLDDWVVPARTYDLVACVDFTEPRLVPRLLRGLKPKGVLAYVARPRALCSYGPEPGQAAVWFAPLETLVHRESDERIEYLGRRP